MVIDKTTKKCLFPKRHQWSVNNNKLLSGYIRKQTFGIENLRYIGPSSSFNGFQLSKSTTDNIAIAIADDNTGNQLGTVRGTIDDINKAFVHSFNKSTNLDPQFNKYSYKKLIEYLLTKPTATDNQIIQYLAKQRFKSTSLISGISLAQITQCKQQVNQLYKLLKVPSTNYVVDDKVNDLFKIKDVDLILVSKSYRSKADQFNYDKKAINDRRYKRDKIISTILHYRLINKQIIPININIPSNGVYVWDPNTKLKVDKILSTKIPTFKIESINWDSTLTSANIAITDKRSIVVTPDSIVVDNQKMSVQYQYNAFQQVLTHDTTVSWPATFKDNTTMIKTVITAFDTSCKIDNVVKTPNDFETLYQELQPEQQQQVVTVLKIIRRILDTFVVDNPTMLMYYLLSKQSSKCSVVYM